MPHKFVGNFLVKNTAVIDLNAIQNPMLRYRMKLATGGLIPFIRTLFPDMAKQQNAAFHYDMAKRLTDLTVDRYNVVAPRGHAKSSIACTALALWHIFCEHLYRVAHGLPIRGTVEQPEHNYVLLIGHSLQDGKQKLTNIKKLLGEDDGIGASIPLRTAFGDYSDRTARTWQAEMVRLRGGHVIRCLGAKQNVHGLNEGNVRPTLVIVDDPENTENTKMVETMEANLRWLYESIIPGVYPEYGRVVVIGTPLEPRCMVVKLHRMWMSEDKGTTDSVWYRHSLTKHEQYYSTTHTKASRLNLRPDLGDEVVEDRHGVWLRRPGLLWPKWMSAKKMASIKKDCETEASLGLGAYYRQYECQIRGDTEEVFQDHWFDRTWEGSLVCDDYGETFLKITRLGDEIFGAGKEKMVHVRTITGYDPAYSVGAKSSNTAACALAVDREDNCYELPWVYGKYHPAESISLFLQQQEMTQHRRGVCEANGPQIAMFDLMRREGIRRLIKDSTVDRIKKDRVSVLQYPMANMKFWFKRGTPARDDALDFPGGSMDYLDAMAKAWSFRIRGGNRVWSPDGTRMRAQYYSPMTA